MEYLKLFNNHAEYEANKNNLTFPNVSYDYEHVHYKTDYEYDYVDLGLPSGTLGATCNVGAHSPEEYGDYFAGGETSPKEDYSWSTYAHGTSPSNPIKYNSTDGLAILELEDDAAHVNGGSDGIMPTDAEWTELRTNCTGTGTTQNSINGYMVTGTNNNSIFLPAAGYRYNSSLRDAGSVGLYWSSSLYEVNSDYARSVDFYSEGVDRRYDNRCLGRSVRPISYTSNQIINR